MLQYKNICKIHYFDRNYGCKKDGCIKQHRVLPVSVLPQPATVRGTPSKFNERKLSDTGKQIGLIQSVYWAGRCKRSKAISFSCVFDVGTYSSCGICSITGISCTGSAQLSSSSQSTSEFKSNSPRRTAVLNEYWS